MLSDYQGLARACQSSLVALSIFNGLSSERWWVAISGLLKNKTVTMHPRAKLELQPFGIEVIDKPLVCHGNIATGGGCLSAMYLLAWVIEKLFSKDKSREALNEIIPVG